MPLLEARNIHQTFSWGRVVALKDVGFSLSEGETLAVVGESGSGKSTLAKIVCGLLKPKTGQVLFEGNDVYAMKGEAKKNFHKNVQIVFQHPLSSLNPRMRVSQILEEPFKIHPHALKGNLARTLESLLESVELESRFLTRRPAELSGGECQRVALARALSLQPRVLICDEAVSALDAVVQAQILNLLLKIQFSQKLSLLFISHDLRVARHMSDRLLVLKEGEKVEEGTSDQMFTRPAHPYTLELLQAAGIAS